MTNPEHREAQKEYKIREATPADAVAIALIQYDSWLKTYPNESAEKENERITAEDIRKYFKDIPTREIKWQEIFEKLTPEIKIFVAEDDGRIIAFCKVEKKDGDDDNRLDALYMESTYEGKGVASKLVAQAFVYLGNEKPMKLEVAAYNGHAQAVYEHYGFEKVGEMDFPRPINGKNMRLNVMRRPAQK